jgi:L,D-transpeptidase catalytic domain
MGHTKQRAMLILLLALLVVPAAASAKSAKRAMPYSPSQAQSFDAVLSDWTPIAKTPGGKSVFELQPATFYEDQAQRLLVLEARDVDGVRWLKVRLPAWFSHGMTAGWLKADRVKLRVNRWRVEISRSQGTLKILREGKVVRTAHVGTGTSSTPTPVGLHATYDHWRSDHAVLGDWTVSLTTHSPEVPVFDGQQAVVAIHGWHASGGGTGSVSHGCVRVTDDSLMRMVALELPVGTPVLVS